MGHSAFVAAYGPNSHGCSGGVVSAATVLHVACRLLQEHCVLSVVLMQQWMLLRSADLPRLADELIRRLRGVVGTVPSELPICTIECRVSCVPLSYPAAAWPTGIRSPFTLAVPNR